MGSPGEWWVEHHRQRAAKVGTGKAAANLRKQGVPLEVALQVLAPKPASRLLIELAAQQYRSLMNANYPMHCGTAQYQGSPTRYLTGW